MKKRGTYPYSLEDPLGHFRGTRPKKRKSVGPLLLFLLLISILAGGAAFLLAKPNLMPNGIAAHLPFPKKMVALRVLNNGQEALLLPDTQCVLNPRDSFQIVEIKTDGWLSIGTKLVSPEMNAGALRDKGTAIRDLFPKESFETPKTVNLTVTYWGTPIGNASLVIQLDSKDWIQKASATPDAEKKIAYLDRALKESPGNILVKTQLAGLFFESKRYDEAARLYKEIDESGKTRPILDRLLAIYQYQNHVDDALGVYLDILKLSSDDQDIFKEFVGYLQKRKSKDEAVKFLERRQNEIPKAFQSSLHLLLADLNTQTKNWSKAAASYERAVKSGVKDPDVLYNLAVTYQQSDDPDKAIHALEKYLQKNPQDMKSWMQLGELQEKKGALSQARATYEGILQRNPQHRDALVHLVAILEKGNDKAALQGPYEKLAQLQPRNKTVQYNLAILYYGAKKWDKAAQAFETVASIDPKDIESRKYLLDLYRKQKNDKGEMEMLRVLAQLDSKNSSYYDAIFKRFDEKKDYKGLVVFFKALADQHPDSVSLHNYLLYGALKGGDNKAALRELEQLIRLQPKEKKHLKQAANLYEHSGDYGEALKKIDMILKMDPKDKEAKDDYMRVRMLSMKKKPT